MPQQDTGTAEQYEAEKLLDVTTPRRYHSGEIDHMGSISKCRDAMMRTLLFEAA